MHALQHYITVKKEACMLKKLRERIHEIFQQTSQSNTTQHNALLKAASGIKYHSTSVTHTLNACRAGFLLLLKNSPGLNGIVVGLASLESVTSVSVTVQSSFDSFLSKDI